MSSLMHTLVADFANQLKESLKLGDQVKLSPLERPVQNIVVLGLGGSAFGGELVIGSQREHLKLPFNIFRGYQPAANLTEHTLVIASSYSGNTEETLESAQVALERGAQMIVITSGGKLAELAEKHNCPCLQLPSGYPPRAACGFSFVQQLVVLHQFGFIPDFREELEEAIELIEHFDEKEEAEALAKQLHKRMPIIYSSDAMEAIAIRFRQQINENGKQLCWHHVLPEMNHNELVGWAHPEELLKQTTVVNLRSAYDHPRVAYRFEITKQVVEKYTTHVVDVLARGESRLAQLLYLLHFVDWVSIYLADANGIDPTPVKVIDFLKGELAKR